MTPYWISAFLDFAPSHFDAGVAFWRALTGYDVSAPRGDEAEFATLVPPDGDAALRVQRLVAGEDRIHLDLHVDDPVAAAERATGLGAAVVAEPGYVVLRSPGGLTFCFVSHAAAVRPGPTTWPGGHRSVLDQVCIDVPRASYDTESAFWAAVTGWELLSFDEHDEFEHLARAPEQPLRILLQRLDEPTGETRAHLDWATDGRDAEVARHLALGAREVERYAGWTVLADPLGRRYCVTVRDPVSRRTPGGTPPSARGTAPRPPAG